MSNDRLPPDPEAGLIETEEEDKFDFKDYGPEDYVTLVLFWVLLVVVFLQFFSRYVMGDSIAWTEEMARYFLITVGFLGSAMAVRKNSHIAVEFFFRYMPGNVGLAMSTIVDLVRVVFLVAGVLITYKLADRTNAMMVSVDIPKSVIYYIVLAGFVLMLVRSIQVAIRHWREGTSELIFTEDDR
ncbi:ABC transporter permease [Litchfieldella qijiaojingensis]|uniref:TRAP transporter small permease protein n=1 Tax=Litchfieldella qijiaojingensis TaxID=980347 RepID=A0ABQ2Z438_9GAMM|nr:TRAP transporter small permease [Halomonas qijiaojingensis]GGY00854.1 ABC transporter permease [Halomonas qijiaojingensis]